MNDSNAKPKKDGPSEHKKCLCKDQECSWAQKGQKCPITSNENSDATPGGSYSGDVPDLTYVLGFEGLRSIVREVSLTNNGNINVNLNLR